MGTRYRDLLRPLRIAYDRGAEARDRGIKEPWKQTERAVFLERLRSEGTTRLLEIGAGTGQDSAFFRDENLDVVATDLSPAMVERCRAKGLHARVMDFMNLDFPAASLSKEYSVMPLVSTQILPLALSPITAGSGVAATAANEASARVETTNPAIKVFIIMNAPMFAPWRELR